MKFTDIFIRRPVLALVISFLIIIAGLQAVRALNVRQYPRSENAVVTVTTVYVGANAELIRGFITTPLERAIAAADGIDYIQSQSSQGVSTISARLKLNYDPIKALSEISSKVDQIRGDLPPEAEVPTINVESADSQFAAAYLSFTSEVLKQNQITDFLVRSVQPRLSAIEGVQRADILGGRTFAMRIWLKPKRMAALSISPVQVQQALAANAGEPPEKFLLQDNGRQYISEKHNRLLDAHEIVGRHVPPYTPQYNGAVECGGKEFKNVFYNVWERRKTNGTDKEKTIDERAHLAAAESVHLLNDEIPRPALGGVTPADVQHGRKAQRQKEIKQYRQKQEARGTPPPLSRPFWDVIKGGVRAEVMSSKELLTKIAFFGMRPLRRVAQLNREV